MAQLQDFTLSRTQYGHDRVDTVIAVAQQSVAQINRIETQIGDTTKPSLTKCLLKVIKASRLARRYLLRQ